MKNTTSIKESANDTLIHKALLTLASEAGRQELDITLEDLAKSCEVSFDIFSKHFQTMDQFIVMAISRMKELFIRHVQNPVQASPLKGKDKVWYFLRQVENYFDLYPEAGFLFTMYFFRDIALSEVYDDLECYFSLWQETLQECLRPVIPQNYVKRLVDIYLISLKGQFQLANWESVSTGNYHAERFLTFTLHLI